VEILNFFDRWLNLFVNYSITKQRNANDAKKTFYNYIPLQEEIIYDFSLVAS